jgi:hypothetical protein
MSPVVLADLVSRHFPVPTPMACVDALSGTKRTVAMSDEGRSGETVCGSHRGTPALRRQAIDGKAACKAFPPTRLPVAERHE